MKREITYYFCQLPSDEESSDEEEIKEARMYVITLEEDYICNECGKKYKQGCSLKNHVIKEHSFEKVVFKCNLCSNTFDELRNLKNHARVHKK